MGKILVLNYVGNDSCDRPVYENHGLLFVDVNPLSYKETKICTKAYNCLNGEPDTPIQYISKYKDMLVDFFSKRIVWR